MAADQPDTVPYTGDKASQVFAVPELLENILSHLLEDGAGVKVPSCAMFKFLRVDKSFRDTITSSPKLQKAMFLRGQAQDAHLTGAEKLEVARHACGRLTWLISAMSHEPASKHNNIFFNKAELDKELDRNVFWMCLRGLLDHPSSHPARLMTFDSFEKHYGARDASWRKVLVCPLPDTTLIVRLSVEYASPGIYYNTEFKSGATLGEVFEWWQKLMQDLRQAQEEWEKMGGEWQQGWTWMTLV